MYHIKLQNDLPKILLKIWILNFSVSKIFLNLTFGSLFCHEERRKNFLCLVLLLENNIIGSQTLPMAMAYIIADLGRRFKSRPYYVLYIKAIQGVCFIKKNIFWGNILRAIF